MDVIVLAAQKGGSNKSTICVNLAVEAVRQNDGPVTLVDIDPQGSLTKWWNRRASDTPALVEVDLENLETQLAALAKAGTRLVIVDTPGVISSHVRAVIKAATLVIIPSRASIFDVETLYDFCDLVESEGRPMVFVPSSIKARSRIGVEAIRNMAAFGVVGPSLSDRVDFSQSLNDGHSAAEIRPGGDAAREIEALWTFVKTRLRKRVSRSARDGASAPTHKDAIL